MALDSGATAGLEALLRGVRPGVGVVLPASFLGVAEETGVIVPLGTHVLRTAYQALRRFQQATPAAEKAPPLLMSVNVSVRQMAGPGFVDQLREVLQETGAPPRQIKLEIIESLLIEDPQGASKVLARLEEMGPSLAVDDFGPGYSSLSYLHRFPIDTLKVDRSFVHPRSASPNSAAIVQAITGLAGALDLSVVAEGIETDDQRRATNRFGCHFGQGSYLSRTLEEGAAVAFLRNALALGAQTRQAEEPVWR